MSSIEGSDMQESLLGSLQQTRQTQYDPGFSRQDSQNLLRSEGDAMSFSNYAQRLSEVDQELQRSGSESARQGFRSMVQELAQNPDQADLDSLVQANASMDQEERVQMAATAQNVLELGGREMMREWSNQASRLYSQDAQSGSSFVQASSNVLEVSQNEQNQSGSAEQNLEGLLELSSRTGQSGEDQSLLQEFLNDVQSAEDNDQLQGVYQDYYQRVAEAA